MKNVPAINHKTLIRIDADKVYETLTTGAGWDAWFTDGTRVDIEDGVGEIRLVWKKWGPDSVTAEDGGTITKAEPNQCFEFQWSPGKELVTTVNFQLEEVEDGTVVTVTETGYDVENLSTCIMCATGWGEALTLLKFYLEHGISVNHREEEIKR
ncbi:SRPBCC domain-containing protein [Alkalihalobacillus sp. AL-G]|uniref:SRPBCC family protein n=1 Tax=Alkalihalobacillus sp. AL-G TaxID=2926399 RepID=UPI002729AFD3|nr:SRPBCC domain-containing protein [Alkalihalobacillus sp. AL-G]WLD94668.1 SRPBCC domain-containing protein [Alkalihalobacillus sp. AL-G]